MKMNGLTLFAALKNLRVIWKKSLLVIAALLPLLYLQSSYAGFTNGGFEDTYTPSGTITYDAINGWTLNGYIFNGNSSPTSPAPTSIPNIQLGPVTSPGGVTDIVYSLTPQSIYDWFIQGAIPELTQLLPIYGTQTLIINLRSINPPQTIAGSGSSAPQPNTPTGWTRIPQQATSVTQTITLSDSDIDPSDGKIHIRFIATPVMENPSHNRNQQPFIAIQLNNITTGRTGTNPLFFQWNYGGQPGVPWTDLTQAGTNEGSDLYYQYVIFQAFDIAPGNAFLHVGDSIQLEVMASGCSLGGHDGHMYLDQVQTYIAADLWVVASGPISTTPGSNITYTYTYTNSGSAVANNVEIVANMPQQGTPTTPPPASTTFVSVTTPTAGSSPSCSGTSPVTCSIGTLQPGETGTFQLTVHVPGNWALSTGPVNNGNYPISATGINPLLGPLVQTALLGSSSLSNLVANASGLPNTGTIGTPYTGTFTCSNIPTSTATGSAPLASCDVTNLPAGLSVSGCSISPPTAVWTEPATILSNQTVTCTVSGTPTTSGTVNAIVSTDATNNSNSTSNTAIATIDIPVQQFEIFTSGDGNENISPNSPEVNSGDSQTFTITPNPGYTLSQTVVTSCPGGQWLNSDQYSVGPITADCDISFSATLNAYTVTASGDTHVSASPPSQSVNYGSQGTVTLNPSPGYSVAIDTDTCNGILSGTTYQTGTITADCAVSFKSTIESFTVSASGDSNVSASPPTQSVNYGLTGTVTLNVATGYTATIVSNNCGGGLSGNTFTSGAITSNCSVIFGSAIKHFTVSTSGDGHETVSPPSATVDYGNSQVFMVTPDSEYAVTHSVGGSCPVGTWLGNQYTTGAITGDCTVSFSASFAQFLVTPSGDGFETYSPDTPQTVSEGNTQTFILTPNSGFILSNTVGGTCPAGTWSGNQYTTGAITASCTSIFSAQPLIPATLNGSPIVDPAVVCCGRPVLLGPLPVPGDGPTNYTVVHKTGDVTCMIGHSGAQTYLRVKGLKGSCTIIGTKDGITSAPFTVSTP